MTQEFLESRLYGVLVAQNELIMRKGRSWLVVPILVAFGVSVALHLAAFDSRNRAPRPDGTTTAAAT